MKKEHGGPPENPQPKNVSFTVTWWRHVAILPHESYLVTLRPDPPVRDVIHLPNAASFTDPVDTLTLGGPMAHLGTSGILQIWSVRSIFRRLSDPTVVVENEQRSWPS